MNASSDFSPSPTEYAYKQCKEEKWELNEDVVKFLLGYHLLHSDETADLAFEVRNIGDFTFSPDVDLLGIYHAGSPTEPPKLIKSGTGTLIANKFLIGYETKGIQASKDSLTRSQVYKGIGQATELLSQPTRKLNPYSGAAMKYAYLVLPSEIERKESFITLTETVRQSHIGLITVSPSGINNLQAPNPSKRFLPENAIEVFEAVYSNRESNLQNVRTGLSILAEKLIKNR